jgi:membrane-bound lytic murein transglycosylase D
MTRRQLPWLVLAAATLAACAPAMPGPGAPVPVDPEQQEYLEERDAAERAGAEADAAAGAGVAAELPMALPEGVAAGDFDLPIVMNERVAFWMDFFQTRSRRSFEVFLRRQGRYESMIRERLRARSMPEDLIYVALVESGFAPRATSPAAAVGIWQFIPETGRRYGLEVSEYIDERRDPVKSTDAALAYLFDLHRRFGSWYLAAAAYNTGENRVERILREHAGGARGADSLFWVIDEFLPRETRNYVPMILGAAILAKHPALFGFGAVVPEPAERFETAVVPDATEIAILAEAAGISEAELRQLNPHFLRDATPPGRQVELRLPPGRAAPFTTAFAAIPPERRLRIREHVVRPGETLSGIAARHGTTVAALQAENGIARADHIQVGRKLRLPRGAAAAPAPAAVNDLAPVTASLPAVPPVAAGEPRAEPVTAPRAAADADLQHTVRPGESLWTIARAHGVTVDQLRAWNRLGSSDTIRPGQLLAVSGTRVLIHTVRPGENLSRIARAHGVTTRQLMEWNGLQGEALIRPGEEIRVQITR